MDINVDYRKKLLRSMTVREFANFLMELPEEQQNWLITCCGCDYIWMHFLGKDLGEAITIDTEQYIRIEDQFPDEVLWDREDEYTEE